MLRRGLSRIGVPRGVLELLPESREAFPKIPNAKGSVNAIRGEAFFLPLYQLFITYGGIFRLTFGPKVFVLCKVESCHYVCWLSCCLIFIFLVVVVVVFSRF